MLALALSFIGRQDEAGDTAHGERGAEALIMNANLGGDSCHRGSLLGVIVGCAMFSPSSAKALRVGISRFGALHRQAEIDSDVAQLFQLALAIASESAEAAHHLCPSAPELAEKAAARALALQLGLPRDHLAEFVPTTQEFEPTCTGSGG